MSPGAKLSLPIAPKDPRGMRSPRHTGYIPEERPQQLQPFFAAPLRPGETLKGISIVGHSMLRSVVNIQQAPLAWAEMGVWVIPLSALAPFFLEIVTGTGEDVGETSTPITNVGAGVGTAANPTSGHGHMTPGLQAKARRWAGELGGTSAGNTVPGSQYAPYVSYGTHKVADDWYDRRDTGARQQDPLLHDLPPHIERFVRGALTSSFDSELVGLDPDVGAATSLADMIEAMFLLTTTEHTYAEYLAAHSVNPRNVASMSRPILLKQGLLQNMNDTSMVFSAHDDATGQGNLENNHAQTEQMSPLLGATDRNLHYDRAAYGVMGHSWTENRRRNLFIEEPSILLGTMTWYPVFAGAGEYSGHFDMTRMTHPGHWGSRIGGGFEEDDFIATQLLYDETGTVLQGGDSSNQTGDAVFNMLNLFLHGDIASISPLQGADPTSEFRYRQPGGLEWSDRNQGLQTKVSVQLHILSDLVA